MQAQMRPWLWVAAAAVAVTAAGVTTVQAQMDTNLRRPSQQSPALPIGPADLTEVRTPLEGLPAGVTGIKIVRGRFDASGDIIPDPNRYYTITLNLPVGVPRVTDAFVSTCEAANQAKDQILNSAAAAPVLTALANMQDPGDVRVEPVSERAVGDYAGGPLGCLLRVGRWSAPIPSNDPVFLALGSAVTTLGADTKFRNPVRDDTFSDSIVDPATGRLTVQGPFEIHVVTVDFSQFSGCVSASVAGSLGLRQKVTTVAAKEQAAFAMNGGYFNNVSEASPTDNYGGVPAGISVTAGTVNTGATNGRAALILGSCGEATRIDELSSVYNAVFLGTGRPTDLRLDGLNRIPGKIRDCGVAGGSPTALPVHDFTCTKADDLVLVTPALQAQKPLKIQGRVAEIGEDGTVLDVRDETCDATCKASFTRADLPAGHSLLQAIGASTALLPSSLIGSKMKLSTRVIGSHGNPVPINEQTSIVNGGPELVRDGQVVLNPVRDGIVHEDPVRSLGPVGQGASFYWNFGGRAVGRTMVGVTANGRLLLIQIDARTPSTHSVGLPLIEAANTCKALGAVRCINIDGGSSSASAINGVLVGIPSGGAPLAPAERAVGDVIIVK